MSFDAKKFMKEKWVPRTATVPVENLADYFPEGEKPEWTVRGLTGHELGRIRTAPERLKALENLLEGLASQSASQTIEGAKELIGIGNETPSDVAKRIEMLVIGSVAPECPLELSVRICEARGTEFYLLTTKILELTGLGHEPGKRKSSGETAESKPDSPSATSGESSSTK